MLERAARCHPSLARAGVPYQGIYTPKEKFHKQGAQCTYISIGDPHVDPSKRGDNVNPRFTGKQFMTRPLLKKNAGKGFFDLKNSKGETLSGAHGYMKGDTYVDKDGYIKTQPLDKRKLGFGSHDASKRDEFMSFIRTEQYRQQLKTEKGFIDAADERNDPGGKGRALLLATYAATSKGFPAGRTECHHLYDIGRGLETEFDPKSSRDCFYNQLMSPSRIRPDRRTGGAYISSAECGTGVNDIEMEHPHHGHQHATKQFYDKSHLGVFN